MVRLGLGAGEKWGGESVTPSSISILVEGMTKRQTTANHHTPPQTTTHHRKPPQITTRIWDDNTLKNGQTTANHCKPPQTTANHRKPPQTTSRIWDYMYSCLVKSKYFLSKTRIDLVIEQSMFLFNSFFVRFYSLFYPS